MSALIKGSFRKLPAFPATVHKVTEMVNNPDSSLSDLVAVVRLDQSMTTSILRVCNSAYFGLSSRVGDLEDAVMCLGSQNLYRIVLATGISRFFRRIPGYEDDARQLWEHAVGAALLSQSLSRKISGRDDSALFTSAILHDIGKLILGEFMRTKLIEIKALIAETSSTFLEAEEQILGTTHAQLGGNLAQEWICPEGILEAIAFHHRPDLAPAENPGPWLICLADQGTLTMGYGRGTADPAYPLMRASLKRLGLSKKDFDDCMERLPKEMADAEELLNIVQR